jgi:2-haloacid dehalogenase
MGYSSYTPAVKKAYRVINERLFKEYENNRITSIELSTKRFELLFYGMNIQIHADTFSKQYHANLAKCSMLLPDALETIRLLYPKYRMLLITNGLGDAQRSRFETLNLKSIFKIL